LRRPRRVHRLRPERRGGVRSTCAHQPRNGARWPKEGRVWCGWDGGCGADTAALVRSTRDPRFHSDHERAAGFDERCAEGDDAALATRKQELTREGKRQQKISQ
jgi:hypothetical protein